MGRCMLGVPLLMIASLLQLMQPRRKERCKTHLQKPARGACSLRLCQVGARSGKLVRCKCVCALVVEERALAGALAGRSRPGSAASTRTASRHLHRHANFILYQRSS